MTTTIANGKQAVVYLREMAEGARAGRFVDPLPYLQFVEGKAGTNARNLFSVGPSQHVMARAPARAPTVAASLAAIASDIRADANRQREASDRAAAIDQLCARFGLAGTYVGAALRETGQPVDVLRCLVEARATTAGRLGPHAQRMLMNDLQLTKGHPL